jgi:tRNA-dihydrouridine synthase A
MVLLLLTSSLTSLKSSLFHGKRLNSKAFCTSVSLDGVSPVQTLSVAPMMAHTNRHFRAFWRLISKESILYTEMVVADSIVDAAKTGNLFIMDKHYGHNKDNEDPLVLQLGGNDPDKLHEAAEIAYKSGFRSINLNCGCPSNTIASSNSMGAAMMYTPERTAECCAAVLSALTRLEAQDKLQNNSKSNLEQSKSSSCSSSLRNFSVKCRTGVDELDSYEDLYNFINIVSSQGGAKRFQIHARKAILGQLSLNIKVIITTLIRDSLSLKNASDDYHP